MSFVHLRNVKILIPALMLLHININDIGETNAK